MLGNVIGNALSEGATRISISTTGNHERYGARELDKRTINDWRMVSRANRARGEWGIAFTFSLHSRSSVKSGEYRASSRQESTAIRSCRNRQTCARRTAFSRIHSSRKSSISIKRLPPPSSNELENLHQAIYDFWRISHVVDFAPTRKLSNNYSPSPTTFSFSRAPSYHPSNPASASTEN